MSRLQQFNKIYKYNNFNENWKFKLDENLQIEDINEDVLLEFEDINLPHDWSIYQEFNYKSLSRNEGGLLDGGTAWYHKEFEITSDYKNKDVLIKFGGVYLDSYVFVNGNFVGNYPFGYNTFIYDITRFLVMGTNSISVKVIHKQPSSRWYSGSGIYRGVELIVKEKIHIKENSIVIRTPNLKGNLKNAKAEVEFILCNTSNEYANIDYNLDILFDEEIVASIKGNTLVERKNSIKILKNIKVENPKLWSIETPNLYYLHAKFYSGENKVDESITRFGFRFYDWTRDDGFSLNGKYLKFHGVCLHHDNGALGAEENLEADRRKLEILKEMGVNSIRTSHNPQSEAFIRLCDEMGFLVQEEAFDTWNGNRKKEFDYNRFFNKPATHPEAKLGMSWAEFDIKQMVKRDINSPSIVMWSIGNEIFETDQAHGVEQGANLVKWVKQVDSTRYVTIGENSFNWSRDENAYHWKIADGLDVVGLNYNEKWSDDLREKTDWILYGAETSSAVRSRGIYYNPKEKREIVTGNKDKPNRAFQMSDYGNDRVGWGSTATDSWIHDRDRKYYAGQFIWTGFDYIGEPTPWHNEENLGAPVKSSYFGIVDTCGIPKNDYYFYQSQWISKSDKKILKILPHWNFEDRELLKSQGTDLKRDDNLVPVRVFSNVKKVELFLNGKSLGAKEFIEKETDYQRKYLEGANPDELYLEWLVEFEKGELKAIATDEDGSEIVEIINTASKPSSVRLTPYNQTHFKNGYAFVRFDIIDEKGNIVPTADNEVTFTVENAEIVGVDNGNAASSERYKIGKDGTWKRRAFSGSGLVIVKLSNNEFSRVFAKFDNIESEILIETTNEREIGFEDKVRNSISFEISELGEINNKFEHTKFVACEDFRIATKEGDLPHLPLEANIYSTSGEKRSLKVIEWKKTDGTKLLESDLIADREIELFGKLKNSDFKSKLVVRVVSKNSDNLINSYNYARMWNGSELPAGIASYTCDYPDSEDSTFALNNEIVSYDSTYVDRWSNRSNTHRKQDWAGIFFGRAGEIAKHQISMLEIDFFEDETVSGPKEFKLEYYNKDEISIPKDYSNIASIEHELNDDENWTEIREYKHTKADHDFINYFEFDDVNTHAIRINMISKEDKALAITEIKAFGKTVKPSGNFEVFVRDEISERQIFDTEITFVEDLENIEVFASENASVIRIPKQDEVLYLVISEDRNVERRYLIRRKNA